LAAAVMTSGPAFGTVSLLLGRDINLGGQRTPFLVSYADRAAFFANTCCSRRE